MRKVIDAVTGGELSMEFVTGMYVYHINELDGDGEVVKSTSVSDPKKAKALWGRVKAKAAAGAAEKGVGV